MKRLLIGATLAMLLVAGALVSVRMRGDGDRGTDASVVESHDARLSELEEQLEALDGLREEVRVLTDLVSRYVPRSDEGSADGASTHGASARSGMERVQPASLRDGTDGGDVTAAALEQLKTPSGQEEFYDAVRASVQRYRQEEQQERRDRNKQIERDIRGFAKGPYGKYNLKVNSMAKWLGLNDYQKDTYHTQVLHYEGLIQEVRGREKEDPQGRGKEYHNERQALREEFASVFVNSLVPEQAEVFNGMSEYEKRPDSTEPKMMRRVIYGHEMRAGRDDAPLSDDATAARSDKATTAR